MTARQKLTICISALLVVFVTGTAGYYFIERSFNPDANVTWGQSAYQAIITLSTVGFSHQWELSPLAVAWTAAIISVGYLVVTLAIASLAAMIVGGELRRVLGTRKLKDRISKLDDHYIVCGFGRMGRLISEELLEKDKEVVIVDIDQKRTAMADEAQLNYVLGDASDDATLIEAGIERCAGLVTVLPSDADNVFVALSARGIREDILIISRANEMDSRDKLHRAGAGQVICPSAIGAHRIANLLARPAIASLVDLTMGDAEWEIEEINVQPGSKLAGRSIRDLNLREKANAMVVAIHGSDGTHINPGPERVVGEQDVMVVIAPAGASSLIAQ